MCIRDRNTPITPASSSTAAFDFAVFATLRRDPHGRALSAPTVEKMRTLFPEWMPVLGSMSTFAQTGQVPQDQVVKARTAPVGDDRAAMILVMDAYAHLGTGRLTRVRSVLSRTQTSSVTADRFLRFTAPLLTLLRGDALETPDEAQRALQQAIDDVDYHGILLHSYVCIAISLGHLNLAEALSLIHISEPTRPY